MLKRELTIRIRFIRPSLGNRQDREDGSFLMVRSPNQKVMFMAAWHRKNMESAAQLLGRHYEAVRSIDWDVEVDGTLNEDCWYRRYYNNNNGRTRYARHEAFMPGQVVGINCSVPVSISDDDVIHLMNLAGRYKGLSPYRPGEFGQFVVESVRARRVVAAEDAATVVTS